MKKFWKGFLDMFNWPAVFITGAIVLLGVLIALGVIG